MSDDPGGVLLSYFRDAIAGERARQEQSLRPPATSTSSPGCTGAAA